ncbi:hypothetical protein PC121_g10579 [Phytophthora cactorum]|nr:hypothetical protein PC120_g20957 [Phytophthora cactorum]KAG3067317.1 hypothetical protein PC121_g10579 [Phytophthora cactorum]
MLCYIEGQADFLASTHSGDDEDVTHLGRVSHVKRFRSLWGMTAGEILVLCALLDDAGCSDSMILAVAVLYHPPVERPVVPNIRFCLTAATDADAESDFRFNVAGILVLTSLFALPEWVITKHPDCVHKTEAFCILLHRLSYPKRLANMRKTFGRSEGAAYTAIRHRSTCL